MNKVTRADRIKATKLVKAYLKKKKANQAELSVKLNCYPSQVSYIKNGVRVPGTIIRRILDLLDN